MSEKLPKPDFSEGQTPNHRTSGDLQPEPLSADERQLADRLNIDVERPTTDLLDSAVDRLNTTARMIVGAGLELISAKSRCEHGEYEQLLEQRQVAQQRASELIAYAKFAARLSPKQQERALGLGKSKTLLLARAEREVVEELLESDENFDSVATLSVRDMRRRIKQLEASNAGLKKDVRTHKERANQLQTRNYGDESSYPYPDFVAVARRESHKLTQKAELCIDDLRQLFADHMELVDNASDKRYAEFWETGAAAIYFNAKAFVGQAVQLFNEIESHLPESVTGELDAKYVYNEADVEQAVRDRDLLVQMHEFERTRKRIKRAESKKKKGAR